MEDRWLRSLQNNVILEQTFCLHSTLEYADGDMMTFKVLQSICGDRNIYAECGESFLYPAEHMLKHS